MVNDQYLMQTNDTIILVNIICIIIGAVHNTLLLFRVIYDNTVNKKTRALTPLQKELFHCAIIAIAGYIIMNISFIFVELNSFHHIIQCNMILVSIGFYYFVPKYFGWRYQIIRLNVFTHKIAYSNQYLNTVAISLVIIPIIITLLMIFFSYPSYIANKHHCDLITPLWLGCVCGGLDGIASFFCIYLFYSKMKTLSQNIGNKKMERSKSNVLYLVRKFIILAIVIVMSTYILTFFVMYSGLVTALMSIDSMVNVWCLVLYDGMYDKLYRNIFGCVAKVPEMAPNLANVKNTHSSVEMNPVASVSSAELTYSHQKSKIDTKLETANNASIASMLDQCEAEMDKTISLLLLGPGDSGKSTVLKQMEQIYGPKSQKHRFKDRSTTKFVRANILECIHDLAEQNGLLKVSHPQCEIQNKTVSTFCAEVVAWDVHFLQTIELTPTLAIFILELWNDTGLQNTFVIRKRHRIMDNAPYFFANIERIAQPNYEASFEDYVRMRARTTGIIEKRFIVNAGSDNQKWRFKLTDVGGQRTERRKWLKCFGDIHALIYVMSLAAYDQSLFEDPSQNCYREALDVFEETMKHKTLRATDVIVFLNKNDLFVPKIVEVPFSVFEPEFDPELVNDGNAVKEYLRKEYKKRFYNGIARKKSERSLHFHVTCATDTRQIETVMHLIQFETVRKMMTIGMMM